jgi:hypothetical protein
MNGPLQPGQQLSQEEQQILMAARQEQAQAQTKVLIAQVAAPIIAPMMQFEYELVREEHMERLQVWREECQEQEYKNENLVEGEVALPMPPCPQPRSININYPVSVARGTAMELLGLRPKDQDLPQDDDPPLARGKRPRLST